MKNNVQSCCLFSLKTVKSVHESLQARHRSSSFLKGAPMSSGLKWQGILWAPPRRKNRAYRPRSPGQWQNGRPRLSAAVQFSSGLALAGGLAGVRSSLHFGGHRPLVVKALRFPLEIHFVIQGILRIAGVLPYRQLRPLHGN